MALKDVSQDFLTSIVAIEDHRFYKHRGFDPIGILRAIKANITDGGKSEGASTCLLYTSNFVQNANQI